MQRGRQIQGGEAVDPLREESGGPKLVSSREEGALRRPRFNEECAKLEPAEERALAEEGLAADLSDWPEY